MLSPPRAGAGDAVCSAPHVLVQETLCSLNFAANAKEVRNNLNSNDPSTWKLERGDSTRNVQAMKGSPLQVTSGPAKKHTRAGSCPSSPANSPNASKNTRRSSLSKK